MFEEQAIRLMREEWSSPKQLAEELFAIFRSTVNVKHNGSIEVSQPDDNENSEPPVRINLDPNGQSGGIVINQGSSSIVIQSGDIIINGNSLVEGEIIQGGGGGSSAVGIPDEFGDIDFTPFIMVGRIVSGEGSVYQVEVWLSNPTGQSSGTVQATQLQISDGESIPEGTYCMVIGYPYAESGGLIFANYYIQVPVWL